MSEVLDQLQQVSDRIGLLGDGLRALAHALEGEPTPAPSPVSNGVILRVPYHSQHEADAQWFRKDCGPACVEAIGKYFSPTASASTNEIMQHITRGVDRSTYTRELCAAAGHFFDVDLDRTEGNDWDDLMGWLDEGRPSVVLVHYGSFGLRMDRGWTGGHFMVVCGWDRIDYQGETIERVIVHDPDWYGDAMAQGAFIPVIKGHFMGTWDDAYKDGNPQRLALVQRSA